MKGIIYLDHNATTMIAPEVAEAMEPYVKEIFGNPSSSHKLGQEAKLAIEDARKMVADLIGAKNSEIIFTSGGTESNNMVLKGMVDLNKPDNNHIIVSAVEHPSILNPAIYLMELGVNVSIVRVDRDCLVDPGDVENAIRSDTRLISIMLANNETGTIQHIKEIAQIGKKYGIPVHTDASQALGKIPVNVRELGVDILTIAGHKFYAPKGIGALYIKEGVKFTPLLHGGGQEGGRRSGTENVIMIVGLGIASKLVKDRLSKDMIYMQNLRDRLQKLFFEQLDEIVLNGHSERRLPNTLNISVEGVSGDDILKNVPKVIASTAAACHDGKGNISHVLSAMGVPERIAMGAMRFSVGRVNTYDEIEEAANLIISQIKNLRRA